MQRRRSEWSFRLKEEMRYAKSAKFITLTYNEEMCPRSEEGLMALNKRDLQLFIKRIRKTNDGKIRYYGIGEYGTKTARPHYHLIIFNIDRKNIDGLAKLWYAKTDKGKVNLGHIHIGNVNDASIHYTTKYHVNYERLKFKEKYGIPNEFAVMSKGIGKQYLERAGYWNKKGGFMYVINNGFKQALPRYFRERVFNMKEKDKAIEEAMKRSEEMYEKEVERLKKLGYENPEYEYEVRMFNQSLKYEKKYSENRKI